MTALALQLNGVGAETHRPAVPANSAQAVVVTADGWNTRLGVMRLYERHGQGWSPVGFEAHVDLGKSGLGWGRGPHAAMLSGPEKIEGDKRAPAGVFELEHAFGYAPEPPEGCRMPYRQATERDYFVDDVTSPDYNRWVRLPDGANQPERRWKVFERMRMGTDEYRLGLVVRHNMDPVTPGKGSAIFMHLWLEPSTGTAGCTAMSEKSMLALLRWLDPAKHPVLVQVPGAELDRVFPHRLALRLGGTVATELSSR